MSLNWNWKNDKVGTWKEEIDGRTYKYNLYSGNALLIQIWESDDDDTYQVRGFFCDKEHMKNCLGLKKGYENIYANHKIELELDSNYRHTATIAQAFCKAKWDDDVTLTIKCIPFKRG